MTPSLADRFRQQAEHCRSAGSILTAQLLDGAAAELDQPGPVADLLRPLADDPPGSVPPLRFAGALHRLVLERRAPALAVHYPTVGGTPGEAWPVARVVVQEHLAELRQLVTRPVQTNEVGRSSALLGGLLEVQRRTSLPVRLLEIGASGGLNLLVDRYRHEVAPGLVLGDPASPVRLPGAWQGALPQPGQLSIVERRGCDPHPLDPSSTADRLTLTSYVWADQLERFERLRAALLLAAQDPPMVDRASGSDFLARELAAPREGVVTVVWHSVVRQYLRADEAQRFDELLEQAGQRAPDRAPLAHLWLEPERADRGLRFRLGLRTWPGGDESVLADCQGHGPPVVWRPSR